MGPQIKAVSDTGPLIHLREIGALDALKIFSIIVPPEVKEELKTIPKGIVVQDGFDNDLVSILINTYRLDLAESQAIALAKTLRINLFLTDDLDARTTAAKLGLEPHGTIGILLKAYRHNIFSKQQTIQFIQRLKTDSTLFITSDLIKYILQEIENADKQ
ncbi:MAG: hypothetical protein Q7R47_06120 [Candidatus Diapherotrites archaeon]|nr:hypothetical protein [Candidatus Diapherotrites archaeon]